MDSVTPSKVVEKKELHSSKQRKHTTYIRPILREKAKVISIYSLQNVHKPWKSVRGLVVLGQSETTCELTIIKEAVATAYRFPFKKSPVSSE